MLLTGGCITLIGLCRDLSTNSIGGTIPDNLPVTMQRLYVYSSILLLFCSTSYSYLFTNPSPVNHSLLSGNQLSGSLPSTLSTLTLLTDLYVYCYQHMTTSSQKVRTSVNFKLSLFVFFCFAGPSAAIVWMGRYQMYFQH